MGFIFKINYGKAIRRIYVEDDPKANCLKRDITVVELKNAISSVFKIPATSDFTLVYTDNENDEVLMVEDDDIYDACVRQGLRPVRVTVLVNGSRHPGVTDYFGSSSAEFAKELQTSLEAGFGDIVMRLDQLLLAVNTQLVKSGEESMIPYPSMTGPHTLQGEPASPSDYSSIRTSLHKHDVTQSLNDFALIPQNRASDAVSECSEDTTQYSNET